MAAKALSNQMTRMVRVNRLRLLETLRTNRKKHLDEFNEATAGYKAIALAKVEEAFVGLEDRIRKRKAEVIAHVESFSAETADSFHDYFVILEQVAVNLKKPTSYVEAYDTAIDMFDFETRDEVELSGAETQCFLRNTWDWSHEFSVTNATYGAVSSRR